MKNTEKINDYFSKVEKHLYIAEDKSTIRFIKLDNCLIKITLYSNNSININIKTNDCYLNNVHEYKDSFFGLFKHTSIKKKLTDKLILDKMVYIVNNKDKILNDVNNSRFFFSTESKIMYNKY